MKIRFYRGPLDGKVIYRALPPGETAIRVGRPMKHIAAFNNNPDPYGYSIPIDTYRKTRHTHPDGSVYFEWDQPKGTRFKD